MGTINDYGEFAFWQEGFKISDEVVNSEINQIRYFGYVNREGNWHIMEVDYRLPKKYRFTRGTKNYEENFAARETLDYRLFNVEFR